MAVQIGWAMNKTLSRFAHVPVLVPVPVLVLRVYYTSSNFDSTRRLQ